MPRFDESTLSLMRRIDSTSTSGTFFLKSFYMSSSSTASLKFLMNKVCLGPPALLEETEGALDETSCLLSSFTSSSAYI